MCVNLCAISFQVESKRNQAGQTKQAKSCSDRKKENFGRNVGLRTLIGFDVRSLLTKTKKISGFRLGLGPGLGPPSPIRQMTRKLKICHSVSKEKERKALILIIDFQEKLHRYKEVQLKQNKTRNSLSFEPFRGTNAPMVASPYI